MMIDYYKMPARNHPLGVGFVDGTRPIFLVQTLLLLKRYSLRF